MRLSLNATGSIQAQLWARLTEFTTQLRGSENGDLEDLARLQHLLGRRHDFGELVDGIAEFLLKITDTSILSAYHLKLRGGRECVQKDRLHCETCQPGTGTHGSGKIVRSRRVGADMTALVGQSYKYYVCTTK